MVFDQFGLDGTIATTELAEKILRVVPVLVDVRADEHLASGLDKPPTVLPGVRYDGRDDVRINRDFQRPDVLRLTANPRLV
jgi:hypothetical protein